jgi:hypothetical protein
MNDQFIEGKFVPLDIFQQVIDLIRENVTHKDADFILQTLSRLSNVKAQVDIKQPEAKKEVPKA